jgi:signal transduction histidine kinase
MSRRSALIAAGLILLGQLEAWVFWDPATQGPRALAAAMVLLMALAFVWWRAAPLAVALAASGLYAAWVVIDTPAGSLMPFVLLLAAVLTVADRDSLRRAAIGGAAGLAAIWLEIALTDDDVANYAWTGFFVVAAWLGGRALRRGRERARELEDHAVLLEREREASERAAVAEERARIARELHDVVAHNVGLMVIQSQAAQQAPPATGPPVSDALRSIEAIGQEALTEMRRLLCVLREPGDDGTETGAALAPQPSLRQLDRLADSVRRAGLPVEVAVDGELPQLPAGVDVSAYRIVQEALTNTLKHAGAASARVAVSCHGGALELEITDDGDGTGNGAGSGHGLLGMRERAKVYGGAFSSGPRPEGGYAVRVSLPIEGPR